jgi:histidine ammonia-lyase
LIDIDGASLSCADIAALADRTDRARLTAQARARAADSHRFAREVGSERPVYGYSTGVGANRGILVADLAEHAQALLRSHATSAGPPRSDRRVRAMLAVRLNQLAAGGSGVSGPILDALEAMLAADALPVVREHGSIGTADLAALAVTALTLSGQAPAANPLPHAITDAVAFGPHDAVPFLSSNAATIGDGALACVELAALLRAHVVAAALTCVAVGGNLEAFAEVVERVTPFAGARQVCRWMRTLLTGSGEAARIQDPFGLRTLPQVLGPSLDALVSLDDVIVRLANAPSENPVFIAPRGDAAPAGFAHHGGFHTAYLAIALDTALIAIAQSAALALARTTMLTDPEFTGLPPFLGDGKPGSSGVMMLEYVSASALAGLRGAAPASLQTVVLSQGAEEDASFASLAARQALDAAQDLRVVLACELVAAVRALRSRRITPASDRLARALSACAGLPDDLPDRDLTADIEAAGQVLDTLAGIL